MNLGSDSPHKPIKVRANHSAKHTLKKSLIPDCQSPQAVTVHPFRDPGGPYHRQERVFPPHNSLVGKGQPGVWEIRTDIPDQTLMWLWASFLRSLILCLQLSNEHNTASPLHTKGFPSGSVVKTPSADPGDTGSIPGSGRSPGGEHGFPLQYACLKNPMDRGTWWATFQRVAKSQTQLSEYKTHARLQYEPSSWELSKRRTCVQISNPVSSFVSGTLSCACILSRWLWHCVFYCALLHRG